jgi:hypothetical protein
MKREWLVKTLALGIVVLFLITAVSSTIGISNYFDDTTPPITTVSFDPPEPDGENGWYVSDITVILNATDDMSGVKEIRYIYHGFHTIPGDNGTFIIAEDGDVLFEFWAIDNAGNEEIPHHICVVTNIDRTTPEIELEYEVTGGNSQVGWEITVTATAYDDTSGMNRVEFNFSGIFGEIVIGPGPIYQWVYTLPPSIPPRLYGLKAIGLILNPEITDEYVKFFAIFVIIFGLYYRYSYLEAYAYDNAGNWDFYNIMDSFSSLTVSPGIYLFTNVILPSNYTGTIDKFFIRATFDV